VIKLLEYAGPVPFDLKAPLYNRLIKDKANHPAIFKSLLYSAQDVYGKIDKPRAQALLKKLKTIDTTSHEYKLLRDKIQ
jgi:hypothetical protein